MADDLKDVPYEAEWTANLRHRPDPNRVESLQTSVPGAFPQRPGDVRLSPPGANDFRPALSGSARASDPQSRPAEPSYYDVPMLKQPVWKWQIALYFYLGGLSAGAYVLGRAADRVHPRRHRKLAKLAAYIAMGALLPSPPLLIADLGDPKRFHHMLRVWKPGTPMNLGTWSIVAYSGMAAYEVVRQYLCQQDRHITTGQRSKLLKIMNNGTLLLLHDAAGVPFSLMVAGYTGVLLSCTSNPLWCKNPWLGPLFSASALSTGAEAISLAMDLTPADGNDAACQQALQNVDSLAHAAEMVCVRGFRKFAGEKAAPAHRGPVGKYHRLSMGGMVVAEVLKRLPAEGRYRKPVRMAASALGLAAGLSLRWWMIFGGHAAAADPHTSRLVSRPQDSAKRVGGSMPGAGGRPAHGRDRASLSLRQRT